MNNYGIKYIKNENFIENGIQNLSNDKNVLGRDSIDNQMIINTNNLQCEGDRDEQLEYKHINSHSQIKNIDNQINNHNDDNTNFNDNINDSNQINNINDLKNQNNQMVGNKYQSKNIDNSKNSGDNLSLIQKPKNSNLKNKKGVSKNGVYPTGSRGKKSGQVTNYGNFKINVNDSDYDEDDNYDNDGNDNGNDNDERNKDIHKSINHNYYYYQNNEK
jgi:hypothetical protein